MATRINPLTGEEEEVPTPDIAPSPTDQRILAAPPHTEPLAVLCERAVNARGESPGVDVKNHVGPSLQEDPLPGETPLPYVPVNDTPVLVLNPDVPQQHADVPPENDPLLDEIGGIKAEDLGPYKGQDVSDFVESIQARQDAEADGKAKAEDLPEIVIPTVESFDDESDSNQDTSDHEPTREELLHEAQGLDIPGRSSMNKEELVEAVEEAKEDDSNG